MNTPTLTTRISQFIRSLFCSINRQRGMIVILPVFGLTAIAFASRASAQTCNDYCDPPSFGTVMGWGAFSYHWPTSEYNTVIGQQAMYGDPVNYSSGSFNTAIGYQVLYSYMSGSSNTGIGHQALFSDTSGNNNTATGYESLFKNTSGGSNTADGYFTLFNNTTGNFNTATGQGALFRNTTASNNTASGYQALNLNRTGTNNTATGTQALQSNTASNNTANGYQALNKNTTGSNNVAMGNLALFSNTTGGSNTAIGVSAGYFTTGSSNIAMGINAGTGVFSGSNNIDIGNNGANESSTIRIGTTGNQTNTYIAGISGATVPGGVGVIVDSSGHLGTTTSSARYKENIKPMDKASEAILSLEPVMFRYKHELDPAGIPQFGLVAEEVEKINPDLVARDRDGKPYTVRYDAVNAMLLNEFLKEHRKVENQQRKIESLEKAAAEQQKENAAMRATLKDQMAQIQQINAQLATVTTPGRVVSKD